MSVPRGFVDHPFAYHEEVELEISTLTNLGWGLGRIDGWVVMVPYALPGEKVRARVFRNFKNYSDADLVEVLDPSPHRIKPNCSLFGECGGCQYQNLAYEQQLVLKRQHVAETLEHIAQIKTAVEPVMHADQVYGYRSKLTPHFDRPIQGEISNIGFLKQGSRRQIVDVEHCPIATDNINIALKNRRHVLQSTTLASKRGATLLFREGDVGVVEDSGDTIRQKVGKWTYELKAGDFFQNNPYVLPLMIDYVIQQARGSKTDYLLDLYCGVGLFAIAGSEYFKACSGIEVNERAVTTASKNAVLNQVSDDVKFFQGSAEIIFDQVDFKSDLTSVIIDPPRKGCSPDFLQQLIQYAPQRIVYVSCDPATQSRDLKVLLADQYQILKIQPFDLFPQTRHIENVVTLVRQ